MNSRSKKGVDELVIDYNKKLTSILSDFLLPDKKPVNPSLKAIHDPIWGSQIYYPWEVALIDTPLCQRLRQIYQLGTAFLTYPSAVHTRFSHTLGVVALAGRLINCLKEKIETGYNKDGPIITKNDIYTVRCAALLHDVGHCFFSHASEKVLGPIIEPVRKKIIPNVKPKPHEFLSYLIVTNKYFKKFWEKHIIPLFPNYEDAPDPDIIGKLIIGVAPSEDKRFLKDIIYGPFDVDKLEYLYRDARTTGLEVSYDIERYFYKIELIKQKSSNAQSWRLAMNQGGVRAVEQIIFSKLMLFSFVYHHQKILSSDILVSDLVNELLLEESDKGNIKVNHPLDCLRYTDADIFTSIVNGPTEKFDRIRDKIFKRDLPKRCFVLNKEFVINLSSDDEVKKNWDRFADEIRGLPEKVIRIRTDIVELIKKERKYKKITIEDLHVIFPKAPEMSESATAAVVGADGELQSMGAYFDFEGWQRTYNLKKLRGYFFTSSQYREIASNVIEKYLHDNYNLKFSENAKIEAKIHPIIKPGYV